MDEIVETYRGVEIFETMSWIAGSTGDFDIPAHKFTARINGEKVSVTRERRHMALNTLKNKIDHYKS